MTTAENYDLYHKTLWNAWNVRTRAELAAAYPATGGIELYVHNWIVCGKDATAAAEAQALISAQWDAWHRISDRGRREYDRLDHKRHCATFQPLWCAICSAEMGR